MKGAITDRSLPTLSGTSLECPRTPVKAANRLLDAGGGVGIGLHSA